MQNLIVHTVGEFFADDNFPVCLVNGTLPYLNRMSKKIRMSKNRYSWNFSDQGTLQKLNTYTEALEDVGISDSSRAC